MLFFYKIKIKPFSETLGLLILEIFYEGKSFLKYKVIVEVKKFYVIDPELIIELLKK